MNIEPYAEIRKTNGKYEIALVYTTTNPNIFKFLTAEEQLMLEDATQSIQIHTGDKRANQVIAILNGDFNGT